MHSFSIDGCGRNPECAECPVRTRVISTLETGKPHIEEEGEMTFLRAGKKDTIALLITTMPLNLDNGKKVLLSLTDITQRKKTEEDMKESEAIHRELFDNSPTPMYIQDFSKTAEFIKELKEQKNINDIKFHLQNNPDAVMQLAQTVKILRGNNAAALMYKAKTWDELFESFAPAIKQDNMQHFIDQIVDFTNGKDWFEGEARNFDCEGNVLDVLFRKTVINRKKNGLSKIIVSATDLTNLHKFHREKAQLEIRLQQAQKMESIGSLAGGIAHDFNNILFPIVGLAEMLMEDLPEDTPENENAMEILKAGKRGSELVKQILAFSRQDEHKMAPVRIQHVMKEVLKLSRSSIPVNIEINYNLDPKCGLVLADSTQLHQIGMNLITNSYHAVEDRGGKIDVEVREIRVKEGLTDLTLPPGKYAMLSVADNGTGIDKKNLDKIFEPYFTTKEQGKGTGLGLSVVYGIVKEHKGEIKVLSEPGKGTSFQIYIPVMVSSAIDKDAFESTFVSTGTEHILLVDDEVPIANLEKQMLERLGYEVSKRTSSTEALEAFRTNPEVYDLVISDMSMPQMTGDRLAEEIQKIRPDIPIIICTGFSERISKEEAFKMGIKGFLMKPVVKSEMAEEVRRVLDGAQSD